MGHKNSVEAEGHLSLPSDERSLAVRAQQQADARAYLERTGNADLLEVLGLVDPPAKPRRPNAAVRAFPAPAEAATCINGHPRTPEHASHNGKQWRCHTCLRRPTRRPAEATT